MPADARHPPPPAAAPASSVTFVPTARLLACVAGVAAPALAGAFIPEAGMIWMLALGGLVIAALADLVNGLGAARTFLPLVQAPAVVRLSREADGIIPFVITARDTPGARPAAARRLRFAPGLPSDAFTDQQTGPAQLALPAGGRPLRLDWACRPSRRGHYTDGVLACCATLSALGLWELRSRQTVPCELRVYPNLFAERRALAALFLDKAGAGLKARRTVGRGREFEKLRDYLPGDGLDEIHWKATARRGRLITRQFQAERTQEVYAVIDLSRLSGREVAHANADELVTPDERDRRRVTVLERYLTSALVLMLAARSQGDRFGLIAYDDRVRVFIRAGGGAGHFAACREAMCALQPGEGAPDIAEVTRYLRTRLRTRALLVFLTDLGDPVLAEDFVKHAPPLARQHLLMVNQVRAPGVARLFSGEPVATDDDVYARLAGHFRWAEAGALARLLRPSGIRASLLEEAELAAQMVTQYMQVKRRQAL
ncbi:hypothetical protein OPIT5_26405 [Opitutaceae bacterium TAV5]|nr:hypothetical protein OPIT5_26405 [Opitutaceae bacterium TAV5]